MSRIRRFLFNYFVKKLNIINQSVIPVSKCTEVVNYFLE